MWTDTRKNRAQWILALTSGVLLFLSFPKFDQGYLAWCALVPLLLALRQADWRTGFMLGLATGLVQFIGLIYWTAYAMNVYGMVPLIQSILVLFLFAFVLALFTALFGMGVGWFCRKPWQLLVLTPAIWALLEWLRSWAFTGFPWELLGYSQYNRLWVIQIADLFGVLGISALIVFFNAVLVLAVLRWLEKSWRDQEVLPATLVRSGVILGGLLLLTAGYGIYRLHATDQKVAKAPDAKVAVVQGNVDQAHKWDAAFQVLTTSKYKNLSLEVAKTGVDLIVWPETAVPFYIFHDELLTRMVVEGIKEADTYFLIGSPSAEVSGDKYLYYNSAYLFSPDGEVIDKYDKVHLVPFGEYVPMKRWLPFVDKMVAQVGDFQAGRQGNTLDWKQHPIGMLVCYEVIFPDLARAMVQNGAQILVNITNDAWFGRTSAAYQHFSMAVLRSVENRRFLARAANTGISGFIDPCGRIIVETPLYRDRALAAKVSFLSDLTYYTRWGDWPLVISCLIQLLIIAGLHLRRERSERNKNRFSAGR